MEKEKENENGKESKRWLPDNLAWIERIFSSSANVRSFHASSDMEVKSNENALNYTIESVINWPPKISLEMEMEIFVFSFLFALSSARISSPFVLPFDNIITQEHK